MGGSIDDQPSPPDCATSLTPSSPKQLSIFIHWGTAPCQIGVGEDGSIDDQPSPPDCATSLTPPFRPYRLAIDGREDSENHKVLWRGGMNGSAKGADAWHGMWLANVHVDALRAEQFHSHQQLSIFIHWGTGPQWLHANYALR